MARSEKISFYKSYKNIECLYQVQVPSQLVRGVCVGRDRPRSLLSRGLCQDLGDEVFLCLHCEERFSFLGDLLQHARRSVSCSCAQVSLLLMRAGQPSAHSRMQPPAPSRRSVSCSFAQASFLLIHMGQPPAHSHRSVSCTFT
jgi:hypothetical protein